MPTGKFNITLDPSQSNVDGVKDAAAKYIAAREEMDKAFVAIAKCIGISVEFVPQSAVESAGD